MASPIPVAPLSHPEVLSRAVAPSLTERTLLNHLHLPASAAPPASKTSIDHCQVQVPPSHPVRTDGSAISPMAPSRQDISDVANSKIHNRREVFRAHSSPLSPPQDACPFSVVAPRPTLRPPMPDSASEIITPSQTACFDQQFSTPPPASTPSSFSSAPPRLEASTHQTRQTHEAEQVMDSNRAVQTIQAGRTTSSGLRSALCLSQSDITTAHVKEESDDGRSMLLDVAQLPGSIPGPSSATLIPAPSASHISRTQPQLATGPIEKADAKEKDAGWPASYVLMNGAEYTLDPHDCRSSGTIKSMGMNVFDNQSGTPDRASNLFRPPTPGSNSTSGTGNRSHYQPTVRPGPQTRNVFSLLSDSPIRPATVNPSHLLSGLASVATADNRSRDKPPERTPFCPGLEIPSSGEISAGVGRAQRPSIEASATLDFADGLYFIKPTEAKVVIGRDQKFYKRYLAAERHANTRLPQVMSEQPIQSYPPPTITGQTQPLGPKYSRSGASESGGLLGPSDDGEDQDEDDTGGIGGGTKYLDHGPNTAQDPNVPMLDEYRDLPHNLSDPARASKPIKNCREFSQDHKCPILRIHPPKDLVGTIKSISREHILIQYKQSSDTWTALPLGKNGFFVAEQHYRQDSGEVTLRSGTSIQVGSVAFIFRIPGVAKGYSCLREQRQSREDPISYEFNQLQGRSSEPSPGVLSDVPVAGTGSAGDATPTAAASTAPKLLKALEIDQGLAALVQATRTTFPPSAEQGHQSLASTSAPVEAVSSSDPKSITVCGVELNALDLPPDLQHCIPGGPKKKGPGRPPKNGPWSKREEKELKKIAEIKRQRMASDDAESSTTRQGVEVLARMSGSPQDGISNCSQKRKTRKRKPPAATSAEPGAKKPKRQPREKTPNLELKFEDYTPEQLQKPNKTYSIILFEILSEPQHRETGLPLLSMYKRIKERYPHYHFNEGTIGWQSSVRHNLNGGGDLFYKNTAGYWFVRPGVTLESFNHRKRVRTVSQRNHSPALTESPTRLELGRDLSMLAKNRKPTVESTPVPKMKTIRKPTTQTFILKCT